MTEYAYEVWMSAAIQNRRDRSNLLLDTRSSRQGKRSNEFPGNVLYLALTATEL